MVSSGGFADASGSSGNLAEALFSWTFSFPSGSPTSAQGAFVTVPVGASAFTLSISFPGGYQASASGAVAPPTRSFRVQLEEQAAVNFVGRGVCAAVLPRETSPEVDVSDHAAPG